jgi:hypothetical protein
MIKQSAHYNLCIAALHPFSFALSNHLVNLPMLSCLLLAYLPKTAGYVILGALVLGMDEHAALVAHFD